jgi:hypothetical protein
MVIEYENLLYILDFSCPYLGLKVVYYKNQYVFISVDLCAVMLSYKYLIELQNKLRKKSFVIVLESLKRSSHYHSREPSRAGDHPYKGCF